MMETSKRVLDAEHPDALTYMNQSRWEEAEELEVQVMEMRKSGLMLDLEHTVFHRYYRLYG